jgi:hypothetical protein
MKQYLLKAVTLAIAFLVLGCAGSLKDSEGMAEYGARMDKENDRQNERIRAIDAYIAMMEKRSMGLTEKQEMINRIAVLESKVNDLERRGRTSIKNEDGVDTEGRSSKGQVSVRIKVLSGDGNPTSAKRLALKLGRYGYNVERTDIAAKRNFKKTRIFYSAGKRNAAEEIYRKLGEDADLKPLSWQSVFDIIILTGKPVN